MSWSALATGIDALIDADTGSGGLKEAGGANLIAGAYNTAAAQTAATPYIVFSNVSGPELKAFAKDAVRYTVQFDIYANKRTGSLKLTAITDRLRTVIDRVKPSLSGWTADKGQIVATRGPDADDEVMRMSLDWEVIVNKD